MCDKKKRNKGFTLLEIVLSMAILAIISIPLLNYFVDAARYNTMARKKQEATLIAQNVLEDIKNEEKMLPEGIENEGDVVRVKDKIKTALETKYRNVTLSSVESVLGENLHYIYQLQRDMGNRTYNVEVDIQSEKIKQDGITTVKMDVEPDIRLLDMANDIIAMEKSLYKESAKLYYLSKNIAACEQKTEEGLASIPLTETMLNNGLRREMKLHFSKEVKEGIEYIKTQVFYEYHYSGNAATGIESADLYVVEGLSNSMPLNVKRNVYFFYNPTLHDKITVSGADFTSLDRVYFVKQKSSITSNLRVEGMGLELEANRQHVYTNAYIENAPLCQSLVSEKQAVRMLQIMVSVEDMNVTLTSTKGE